MKTLWTDDNSFFVTRSFEANRDLLESIESKWGTTASTNITKFAYHSNNLSQRDSVVQSGDAYASYYSAPDYAIHQTFTYNPRSELTAAPTYPGNDPASTSSPVTNRQHEFDFDAIGNRNWSGKTGVSTDRLSYTANALNQYSSFTGSAAHTYDADGNLTFDGVWIYSWDAENRLVRMYSALAQGAGTRLELTFKYDHLHRRVQKQVANIDGGSPSYTKRFAYDGWSLVAEYTVSGSTLTLERSYTWGLDIARTLSDAGGVGALLQIVDHSSGKSFHPTYDGNGNIASLVNGSTGALAAVYEYSPSGEQLRAVASDTTVTSQPFRFSTKFTDDETGLIYYGRRYYSPSQGRFLGRDPIEESGGLNLYGFCGNDPINAWDVLGEYADVIEDGNNVTINVPIFVNRGAGVTDADVKAIIDNMKSQWGKPFGDKTVTVNINELSEIPTDGSQYNTMNVLNEVGRSNVAANTGGLGTNSIITMHLKTRATDGSVVRTPSNVAAHELGHVMGLPDQYIDVVRKRGSVKEERVALT